MKTAMQTKKSEQFSLTEHMRLIFAAEINSSTKKQNAYVYDMLNSLR